MIMTVEVTLPAVPTRSAITSAPTVSAVTATVPSMTTTMPSMTSPSTRSNTRHTDKSSKEKNVLKFPYHDSTPVTPKKSKSANRILPAAAVE